MHPTTKQPKNVRCWYLLVSLSEMWKIALALSTTAQSKTWQVTSHFTLIIPGPCTQHTNLTICLWYCLLFFLILLHSNYYYLSLNFQTLITVQIMNEIQMGRGTCGKVQKQFSSSFLVWVCSRLLTHKSTGGYLSNFKCQERCRVNEKYEISDGEVPLAVLCKCQVNEHIFGKWVNLFLQCGNFMYIFPVSFSISLC